MHHAAPLFFLVVFFLIMVACASPSRDTRRDVRRKTVVDTHVEEDD